MLSKFLSESRLTLALAVPLMAGQVSQMMMGLIDSAMVGRVGVTPLAASAFANNVLSIPFVFGFGLLTCISVRIAQSHGAGDEHESGEVLRHGLVLAGGAGLILTGLIGLLSFHLDAFGQNADVVRESRPFLLLLGFSIVPALLSLGLKQFCEALGNPWPPTLILLAAVPLNAFLNWVFIYGNLGASAHGLDGAGMATLLSRILSCLVMATYTLRSTTVRSSLPKQWFDRFHGARFTMLLAIGVPASLQILVEVGAFATGAILVGRLGVEQLAAHQIALTCVSTIFMLPLGLSMATTIRIGQALGSGEAVRVRAIGFSSFGLSLFVMAATAVLLMLFGNAVAAAFVRDPEVAAIAAKLLAIAAIFQLFDGLQVVASGALRGLSDATVPMLMYFLSFWLLGLPTGYYLAFNRGMGAVGIWYGLAMGLAIVAVILVWRFALKSRQIQIMQGREEVREEVLSANL